MKKINFVMILTLLVIFSVCRNTDLNASLNISALCGTVLENIITLEKKDVIVKKYFIDDNTYMIICKGWPKEGLSGKTKIESAKEAALMNAQFIAKDLFSEPVDVVKNGKIKKYEFADDYAVIQYIIKFRGLKRYFKEK